MRNITLKAGQDVRISYGDRSITVGVSKHYRHLANVPVEQDFRFYLTDDRNQEKHTSPSLSIAYSEQDLLWNPSLAKRLKDAASMGSEYAKSVEEFKKNQ